MLFFIGTRRSQAGRLRRMFL